MNIAHTLLSCTKNGEDYFVGHYWENHEIDILIPQWGTPIIGASAIN